MKKKTKIISLGVLSVIFVTLFYALVIFVTAWFNLYGIGRLVEPKFCRVNTYAYARKLIEEGLNADAIKFIEQVPDKEKDLCFAYRWYYEMGYAYYQFGLAVVEQEPCFTLYLWLEAIKAFEKAQEIKDTEEVKENLRIISQNLEKVPCEVEEQTTGEEGEEEILEHNLQEQQRRLEEIQRRVRRQQFDYLDEPREFGEPPEW